MTPFPNYRGCMITQSEMTEEARRPQVTFIIYTRWVTLITNVITVKIRTLVSEGAGGICGLMFYKRFAHLTKYDNNEFLVR